MVDLTCFFLAFGGGPPKLVRVGCVFDIWGEDTGSSRENVKREVWWIPYQSDPGW